MSSIENAMRAWRRALGARGVLSGEEATRRYGACTEGTPRPISAALIPSDTRAVVALVKIAAKSTIPLYPISIGHNWGYGSSQPVDPRCVIVDLSAMNKIVSFDNELGLATLQPGVTQGRLASYLIRNGLPYLAPTTAGGFTCSVIGNMLERGFGLVPYHEHFNAMISLEAVLPTGEIYRSPMADLNKPARIEAFKWGTGPYLDGLFTQGNFGIITRMTIALAPMPEQIEPFFFRVDSDNALEGTIQALRKVISFAGSCVGLIKIANPARLLAAAQAPYPFDRVTQDGAVPPQVLSELSQEYGLVPWTGFGAIYGSRELVAATAAMLKDALQIPSVRLTLFSSWLTGRAKNRPRKQYSGSVSPGWPLHPNESGLAEAYWKSGVMKKTGKRNPAHDGCGIIWYAPVVPMSLGKVRQYVEMIRSVSPGYGIDPLLTLNIVSPRYLYGISPLLFDPSNRDEVSRVHACYEALVREGEKHGFFPYRVPAHAMKLVVDPKKTFWRLAARLKRSIDAGGIMAPGRYNLPGH